MNHLRFLWGLALLSVSMFACESAAEKPEAGGTLPDGLYAEFETSKGTIVARLEMQRAPLTVANFVGLAEGKLPNSVREPGEPYFDGMTFHRVVPQFIIQGGDPLANGMGGPGYKFKNEIHPALKHNLAGTLAMANAGPNTNGSQFYFTLKATPQLDGGYNVFGYVTEGLRYAYQMAVGDTIKTVRILRRGEAAETFDAVETFKAEYGGLPEPGAVQMVP